MSDVRTRVLDRLEEDRVVYWPWRPGRCEHIKPNLSATEAYVLAEALRRIIEAHECAAGYRTVFPRERGPVRTIANCDPKTCPVAVAAVTLLPKEA